MTQVNLKQFQQAFQDNVSEDSRSLIDSFCIFGSLAREETIIQGSDIDSVILLKDQNQTNYSSIKKLSNDLIKLDKSIDIDVDHVIVTQIELFELLSPMLVLGMYTDGINIYGNNLKQKLEDFLKQVTKNRMLNSFLRSRMFYRHLFRKKFLKIDLSQPNKITDKQLISISKDVFLAARDMIYFTNNKYLSKKQDICSYFATHNLGPDWYVNLPLYAYNVRYLQLSLDDTQKLDYLQKSFDYIEMTTKQIIDIYKKVTGQAKLDLNPY